MTVGGTSGIGEATARLAASRGCKVVIAGRRTERGTTIVTCSLYTL